MSLKRKLILLLFAFAIVPALLIGLFVFRHERDVLVNVRMAQLNNIADLKKDKVETFFRERTADIETAQRFQVIAQSLPVLVRSAPGSPSYQKAQKELDSMLRPFQDTHGYLDVTLTDTRGNVVYGSEPTHAPQHGKPLPDLRAFEEGKKGVYFTDVYLDTTAKSHFTVTALAPVRDGRGVFLGEIAIEIDMGPIYDFVRDTTGLGTSGEALLVRNAGDAVLFLSPLLHDPDAALTRRIPFFDQLAFPAQRAAQGDNGSGIVLDYTGAEVLSAWRYLPTVRWGMVTKIKASEALASVERLRIWIVSAEVVIFILGVLAAVLIAKGVAGPVMNLRKGAEIIASGDLGHRVATTSSDEVGQLSRAFDSMTEKLSCTIDDYRKISEELRASEQRMNRSQEIAHLGSWELDVVNNQLYWSDEVYRIFGLQPQEFDATYEAFLEAIHPDDRTAVDAAYSASLREKRDTYEIEHRVIKKSTGEVRFVHEKCEHIRDAAGRIIRSVGMVHDITERREAANEIQDLNRRLVDYIRELEATNRELEAFSYSVSHDLRAPLRSIDGFSHALIEDYADKLGADGRDHLERVRAATQRMGQLIDDLLHLSRVSRSEMRREQVDLSLIARKIAVRLAMAHPERRVKYVVAEGLVAYCDERLLTIALENLLDNAWKFTAGRDPALVEFGSGRHGDKPEYYVRDNGAGFDMAYASKLFAPFQRLHSPDEFPGTGIGLATVQRIIYRHGGRVWAEAEPGKGATVHFTLG